MSTRTISINEVARKAVCAALAVIDEATDLTSRKPKGPCGDELAFGLDDLICKALAEHMRSEGGPAFVTANDLEQY